MFGGRVSMSDLFTPKDVFKASAQQIVRIMCPGKRNVRAVLSDDIQLSTNAQWNGFLEDIGSKLGIPGKILTGISTTQGRTLQQPWMTRKQYQKTEPISFNLSLHFVAQFSARDDVYEPCMTLLSYLYPRELGDKEGGGSVIYDTKAASAHLGTIKNGNTKLAKEFTDVINGLANSLVGYAVPGPSPFTTDQSHSVNDPVTLYLGVYGEFENCYITSCNITMSHVVDEDGYPISADAQVTVALQDNCYVSADGTFSFQPKGTQWQATITKIGNVFSKGAAALDAGFQYINLNGVEAIQHVLSGIGGIIL